MLQIIYYIYNIILYILYIYYIYSRYCFSQAYRNREILNEGSPDVCLCVCMLRV